MHAQPLIDFANTILLALQGRRLTVYPDCASIKNESDRKSCCNKVVVSAAGRKFCYADIIYNSTEFDTCKNADVVEIFKCCEALDSGNKNYAYNCQAELTKSDCTTTEVCTANYKKGLEVYLKYK